MAAPTARPWRKTPHPEPNRTWIEGAEGTGNTELAKKDRRIVLEARLYGDPKLDEETEANIDLVIALANEDADFGEEG